MAPKLQSLQVAGTKRASFNPNVGRASFGVEEGQVVAASALTKVGEVMEGLAIERNQNEGTLAGIEAQKNSSIALFQAQQSDPVNFATNAKTILEETRLNSTKNFTSTHAEKAFNDRWNSFAASRMVNAYQVQEGAQKQQNIAVWDESMDQELQNTVMNPIDSPAESRQEEYLAKKMAIEGIKKDDPRYEIARSQLSDQFHAAQISGYTKNNDTGKAKEMLKSDQGKRLDSKVKDKLKEGIKAKEYSNKANIYGAMAQSYVGDDSYQQMADMKEKIRADKSMETQEKESMISYIEGRNSEGIKYANAVYGDAMGKKVNQYKKTLNISDLDGLRDGDISKIVKSVANYQNDLPETAQTLNNYQDAYLELSMMDYNDPKFIETALSLKTLAVTKKNSDSLDGLIKSKLEGKGRNANDVAADKVYTSIWGRINDKDGSMKPEARDRLKLMYQIATKNNWGSDAKKLTEIKDEMYQMSISEISVDYFNPLDESNVLDAIINNKTLDFADNDFDPQATLFGKKSLAEIDNELQMNSKATTDKNRMILALEYMGIDNKEALRYINKVYSDQ